MKTFSKIKRIGLLLFAIMVCMIMFAQNDSGYLQTKKGSRVRYAIYYADKLRGHVERTVTNVTEDGDKQEVKHLYTVLNKKGKPSKAANMMGYGDGLLTTINLENGAYYLTFDCMMGAGGEDRSGFLLKIPGILKIGDELECGTLRSTSKILGSKIKNEVTFKNFKVTEETILNTPAGNIKCLKITGNVSGRFASDNINETQSIYLAPGIGIVRQEALNYMGGKASLIVEVRETEGI